MAKHGRYNPLDVEHTSALWAYGEVPVASAKLNTWNGNIGDCLNLIMNLAVRLLGGGDDFVVGTSGTDALAVRQQGTPNLNVILREGYALVSGYFAGTDADLSLPETGSFIPPTTHPRIDLISLDTEGRPFVTTGTESATPKAPSPPADTLALAEIHHRPGETKILEVDDSVNGWIEDCRPRLLVALAHRHSADRAPVESADGSRTSFSTGSVFVAGSLEVFVNGVLQELGPLTVEPDSDRAGYTFASAPPAGYRVEHRYLIESL